MGEVEVVHASISQVAERFETRARQSLVVIAVFGIPGLLAVTSTADRIGTSGAALAVFIIGAQLCSSAITMIIGWGASRSHAELARLAADGHERLLELLARKLDRVEAIERKTGEAVVIALDDLRQRRTQRGS